MTDKHGVVICAGDLVYNPWDRDGYHRILERDGVLYLGDFETRLEDYSPNKYWEVVIF